MKQQEQLTFGQFITKRRLGRGITLRGFAAMIDISPEHVCNFEKGRKPAPKDEILKKIEQILQLSKEDTDLMYDLAAKSKNTPSAVPLDLTGFLNDNKVVVAALRMARDVDASDEEWLAFMDKLKAKKEDQ